VKDSSFVMHQGELLAVLGANGSGKSTTCHVLCGITPATGGDALVDDRMSLLGNVGRFVGWCPQHDILFDELTPLEHVNPTILWLLFIRLCGGLWICADGRSNCMLVSGASARKKPG
jgi:energy-coupling factor transporter ATP-binding protein EcfA2